jgi:transcriptional regulator with XRE-family HTH domain
MLKTIRLIRQGDNSDMKRGRPPKSKQSDFGARLAQLRESVRLSQREVAEQLGLAQSSYAVWERRNVAIPPEQIRRLAEIFGVEPEEFFRDEEAPQPPKRGPTGRAKKVFTEISEIPRREQKELLDLIEVMLRAYRKKEES